MGAKAFDHVVERGRAAGTWRSYEVADRPVASPAVTAQEALARIVYLLDRGHDTSHRPKAFQRALVTVNDTSAAELATRAAAGTLGELPGIGDVTARVIVEALAGEVPGYLARLEDEMVVPVTPAGAELRAHLRGDCHTHSEWSDGGAPIEDMARTAHALGHDYMVLTDHSGRLTIAHGLNPERLERQLVEVARINEEVAPFRILTGMEVDILEDGGLDLADDLLARLDVVVASVHSKLRMERRAMTERMVLAVASPHVDILGHCTGRMVSGKRPPSVFDADYVFAACARFNTAVEINSRPERLDPPNDLLEVAMGYGCSFAIDSDAHAPGQLEWQPYGCDKAAEVGIGPERIVNTRSADDLLALVAG
jgi:putative hydrolase